MKRTAVVITSIALAVTGCSDGDDTAETAAPTTTTAAAPTSAAVPSTSTTEVVTTTSASLAATTLAATAAPTGPPATTGLTPTDWVSVVGALGQRRQELYAAPDVSQIGRVCADASPCAEQLNVQLADLASKGWHVAGAEPYAVLRAELEDFDGESIETALVVTLVVVVQRPSQGGSIVDSSGAVVAPIDAETAEGINTENRTTLGRTGSVEDDWRIISQERIREVPA